MKANTNNIAQNEFEQLQRRKRNVYMASLACGVLIFFLSYLLRDPGDLFIRIFYPAFAILFLIMFILVWRNLYPLWKLEIFIFPVLAAMIMGMLAWHFYFVGAIEEHLLILVGGHYWAVGILIVAGFVMLDQKWGMTAGLIIIVLSAIVTGTGIAQESMRGEGFEASIIYLLRIHLFLLLLLGLTSAATIMRQQLERALIRSEVLDQWANTDMLTGLANRRAAEQFLKTRTSFAERYERGFSVILGDVDNFKQVNDMHGHAAGDDVLAGISRMLADSVRESDFVARWGGEEFLIVAPEINVESARQQAERCRSAIGNNPVAGLQVTLSFGVAEFKPGDNVDKVLATADTELYKAKNAGRNRVSGGNG